jgi:hypothetical protein
MSTTNGNFSISVQANEVFTAAEYPGGANESARTLKAAQSLNTQLNAASTPVVDSPPIVIRLSATATIDLTAVQGMSAPAAATRTLDLTGKKVKGLSFKAGATNAAAVNVAPGGSNPYPLFGTANDIDIGPGGMVVLAFDGVVSNLPAVSSTVKNITVTISGAGTLDIILFLGA